MRTLISLILIFSFAFAQEKTGGYGVDNSNPATVLQSARKTIQLESQEEFLYTLAGYSFADVVVFSYFDNSMFIAFDQNGTPIDSVVLNRGEFHTFQDLTPEGFVLSQNYPNPFNPLTHIEYYLPKSGNVEIAVYDLNGRLVEQLQNRFETAGRHQLQFDGSHLSSGFYFLRLKFNGQEISSIRMTLIK